MIRDVTKSAGRRFGVIVRRVHRAHDAGRRWSEGVHKPSKTTEGVSVKGENADGLATITIQNYVRIVNRLAGMKGTAGDGEKEEKELSAPPPPPPRL